MIKKKSYQGHFLLLYQNKKQKSVATPHILRLTMKRHLNGRMQIACNKATRRINKYEIKRVTEERKDRKKKTIATNRELRKKRTVKNVGKRKGKQEKVVGEIALLPTVVYALY